MCGILGIVSSPGSPGSAGHGVGVDRAGLEAMRDRMAHRGPDGSGTWWGDGAAFAHRRLAIVDLSAAAGQPMTTPDGRYVLVYNGELYNDAELRDELAPVMAARGWAFRTRSDAETLLFALAAWGEGAMSRLRGMYAFGFFDVRERRLLLARDPLGVKPLYYARTTSPQALVFASEIPAILKHPCVPSRPDLSTVASYLVTIRTTLGDRTLYDGVRMVRAGEWMTIDASREGLPSTSRDWWAEAARGGREDLGRVITDSVVRHLHSDVPLCCLLSGGLDSSIVASVAGGSVRELHTYCAGAPDAASRYGVPSGALDDFAAARLVRDRLRTNHHEVPVTPGLFAERWEDLTKRLELPLSTPNEVAIYEVAAAMRGAGYGVTLSGEGADELFAGYDGPLDGAWAFEMASSAASGTPGSSAGEFQLGSNAWVPPSALGEIMSPRALASAGVDGLGRFYKSEFARAEEIVGRLACDEDFEVSEQTSMARSERGGQSAIAGTGRVCYEGRQSIELAEPTSMARMSATKVSSRVRSHLMFQSLVNLHGLLLRLDQATMLNSVEGRTPYADGRVALAALATPFSELYRAPEVADRPGGVPRTKMALRRAFATRLPAEIVTRSKASFPLPFQEWVGESADVLRESTLAREVFTTAAIETVAENAGRLWPLAWPMVNVAMWGRRW
jgi:asparagine synthase (glutamine-hydrolysing)